MGCTQNPSHFHIFEARHVLEPRHDGSHLMAVVVTVKKSGQSMFSSLFPPRQQENILSVLSQEHKLPFGRLLIPVSHTQSMTIPTSLLDQQGMIRLSEQMARLSVRSPDRQLRLQRDLKSIHNLAADSGTCHVLPVIADTAP